MKKGNRASWPLLGTVIGLVAIALVMVLGTWWVGQSAKSATDEAVNAVSMLYLDELAGRREQVVATNLSNSVKDINTAIELMDEEDLSDVEHLQAYQARMRKTYGLEKFAFVDEEGTIYTSMGIQHNIDDYDFDYKTITEPKIFVKEEENGKKDAIIAVPVQDLQLGDHTLKVCFMEVDMRKLLEGLSLKSDTNDMTFCNIYTTGGTALTDLVLGGLASENNLLAAMEKAEFNEGYSLEAFLDDFTQGKSGVTSFKYDGIQETLDYVPVEGTDWMLTYLIRESVIANQTSSVYEGIIARNLIQVSATVLVLGVVFFYIITQTRRSARLLVEKETVEARSAAQQEELQQRIALQDKLLEQEKQRAQSDKMITALASDYRGVYYVDLDTNEGICYQADRTFDEALAEGEKFAYIEAFTEYAHNHVAEQYRQGFLDFIDPSSLREKLNDETIISYRYIMMQNGRESYEMLRVAGVRHPQDREDHLVHAIGIGFADVDKETREQMAQSQALNDALRVAKNASKAKTVFLSNMSHEIRTPMNAIIGLDSIALSDEKISTKTRAYLEKIGSSARHLLSLINDILDVSRIESGRMVIKNERFAFSKLLEQVNTIIGGQCDAKGISYECLIVGKLGDCYIGDVTKLRQALINILGNAVKFTPEGGSVRFVVERIAEFDGRSTLRFVIADTGIGMDANFVPRIFEAFSQENADSPNKYGSTGLGMAITKSIVEMMNGHIEVESEKGAGSTFTVTVTLLDSEADPSDSDYETQINPSSLSVLVVDDDPIACEHAKLVLNEAGIEAETVESGAEAMKIVQVRQARRNPFDLILVDWKMPDMDGVETTRQIRSIVNNESAIIILTAYNWDDVFEEALEAGVDSFIAKPLFANNVIEEFQEAFKRKGLSVNKNDRKADLTGRRILAAEDVDINAEILKELLAFKGVEMVHAENGRIAVEMFASSDVGYYDAILMDVRMPEMNGLEATETIRAMDRPDAKTIPIIALTANAFDEDVQRSLQAGLNAHLSKPVEPDSLYETLEGLIQP